MDCEFKKEISSATFCTNYKSKDSNNSANQQVWENKVTCDIKVTQIKITILIYFVLLRNEKICKLEKKAFKGKIYNFFIRIHRIIRNFGKTKLLEKVTA